MVKTNFLVLSCLVLFIVSPHSLSIYYSPKAYQKTITSFSHPHCHQTLIDDDLVVVIHAQLEQSTLNYFINYSIGLAVLGKPTVEDCTISFFFNTFPRSYGVEQTCCKSKQKVASQAEELDWKFIRPLFKVYLWKNTVDKLTII